MSKKKRKFKYIYISFIYVFAYVCLLCVSFAYESSVLRFQQPAGCASTHGWRDCRPANGGANGVDVCADCVIPKRLFKCCYVINIIVLASPAKYHRLKIEQFFPSSSFPNDEYLTGGDIKRKKKQIRTQVSTEITYKFWHYFVPMDCVVAGGPKPLLNASACSDSIKRFAAWRSASRSSAVWRLLWKVCKRREIRRSRSRRKSFSQVYACVSMENI